MPDLCEYFLVRLLGLIGQTHVNDAAYAFSPVRSRCARPRG